MREPDPLLLNLVALPFSLLAAGLLWGAWGREPEVSFNVDGGPSFLGLSPLVVILLSFFAIIFLHELIHALGYPKFGFSARTILAVWPSRLLFYTHYLGGMRRNRWLVVYLLPLLALSVIPVVVYRVFGVYSGWWHFASLLNGLFSGGDLFCIVLICPQVPSKAIMRNQGWATWWKTEETDVPEDGTVAGAAGGSQATPGTKEGSQETKKPLVGGAGTNERR